MNYLRKSVNLKFMSSVFDKVTERHQSITCTNLTIICSVIIGNDIDVHIAVSIGVGAGVSVSISEIWRQKVDIRKLASEILRQKVSSEKVVSTEYIRKVMSEGVGAGVSISIDIGNVIGVGVSVSDHRFTVRKLASESWRQKVGLRKFGSES